MSGRRDVRIAPAPCGICGGAMRTEKPRWAVTLRGGQHERVRLCSRCLTSPDAVWRLRWRLVDPVAVTDRAVGENVSYVTF